MSNQEEKHILTNPWCKKNKAEFFGQGKTADCTCNPEEKKCEHNFNGKDLLCIKCGIYFPEREEEV